MPSTQTADETAPYLAQFEAVAANGASAVPAWLKQLREQAIQQFVALGFPTTRDERWRFTSLKSLAAVNFTLPKHRDDVTPESLQQYLLPGDKGVRLVFVNGAFVESLSTVPELPTGCTVGSLAGAFDSDVVRKHMGRTAPDGDNPFTALNTAFANDGAFVHLPPDVVLEQPVQILFVSTVQDQPAMSHPRNLFILERGASAEFVESYVGLTDGSYLTNTVTEIIVADGARADCYRVQRESKSAYHIATTNSQLGKDSRFGLTSVTLGAALSRHDISMSMQGEGGDGTLNGLYLVDEKQHVDHSTVIEHAVPHCDSHEYFNGILDGHSRAVFSGKIIVRPDAQKTDSKQTNNNLLLSEWARADSQPQLEIYADDVRCTHGATLGPLDEDAIFYLQTRGLNALAARALLTRGFGDEILKRVAIPELRGQLEVLLKDWLDRGEQGQERLSP